MNKKILFIGISIFLCMVLLSGCQENKINAGTSNDKIFFNSDILEIANASFTLSKGKGDVIQKADVVVYFKNRLTKPIQNLTLAIDFCDKDNNILHSSPYEYVTDFPAGYTESSPNRFSYSGSNVNLVDHITIRIIHYKIGS